MFGKKPRLSPLESRKRLLIAESEINRAWLLQEGQTLADELGGLADRASSFNTLALSTMSLVAGLAAFASGKSAPAAAKSSWFQKIASGARLASAIWLVFRSRGSGSEKK